MAKSAAGVIVSDLGCSDHNHLGAFGLSVFYVRPVTANAFSVSWAQRSARNCFAATADAVLSELP